MTALAPPIQVAAVRMLARYFVELTFGDGTARVIDLEPTLWGPVFEPLLANYRLSSQVTIDEDAGTIVWPNGADISPRTLYFESKPSMPATVTDDAADG